MIRIDILQAIWQRSQGPYVFLPTKHGDIWIENPATSLYELSFPEPDHDLYFTPARYTEPVRSLDTTGPLGVLYADLDGDFNQTRLDKYPPSVLWETSPGNMQAVWFLEDSADNPDWLINEVNRKLSHYLGADHGSWIPTKLLRVPGSINYKRGGVRGEVLRFQPSIVYSSRGLALSLPESKPTPIIRSPHPSVPSDKQWQELMEKWWPRIDHRTKQLLLSAQVPDRSLHLARIARRLAAISMPPHEIFGTLSKLATNKFSGRPQVLWESVVLTAHNDQG